MVSDHAICSVSNHFLWNRNLFVASTEIYNYYTFHQFIKIICKNSSLQLLYFDILRCYQKYLFELLCTNFLFQSKIQILDEVTTLIEIPVLILYAIYTWKEKVRRYITCRTSYLMVICLTWVRQVHLFTERSKSTPKTHNVLFCFKNATSNNKYIC